MSRAKVDLHIHTTASDGKLSPAEVVRRAAGKGLEFISLTDHDSGGGIKPALVEKQKFPDLSVIPGIELSTGEEQEIHILGYFIDIDHQNLRDKLEFLRKSRAEKGKRMVYKLANLGLELAWNRVLTLAQGGSIGRPHIAQAMLEKGYISSIEEAFDKYIGEDGPAYVKRERLTPTEAVNLIVEAGGLPVIAHPAEIQALESLILELKKSGLLGLEAYYLNYSEKTMEWICGLAQKHGLLVTGGSDFHEFKIPPYDIGQMNFPSEAIEQLISSARKHNRI